ncbi:MAG: MFS transporter [Candidatus Omnitrophica bacterium]|nr:MFS transporter [Candidatus Omnitrophota bacterium]
MKKATFIILCLEGALLSFNVAASAALVPSIAADFVLSQFTVGKIIWLYMVPYGLAALFYGPLVRAIDARKVELVCIFLFSLANLMAGVASDIRVLFAARFLMGFFGASVIPLGIILIGRHIRKEERGRYIGLFFGATFVASLLGLLLSALISWRLIFLIPACFGFLLWVLMYFFLPSFKEDRGVFRFGYLEALKDKKTAGVFVYIFLASLAYHGVQQWLGVYFSTRMLLCQFYISILITITSFSGVFGELWGGRLADRLGRKRVADLGIIGMVICVLFFLLKMPMAAIIFLMVLWGLSWTFNHSGTATFLTDLPGEFLNEAASLNSGVRFISGGLGAVLGGLLMRRSFSAAFVCFGAVLLTLLFLGRFLILEEK